MRNSDRLDYFYDTIKKLHKENFPDWRFLQLMHNFFSWIYETYKVDGFYAEEDKTLEWLREFCK